MTPTLPELAQAVAEALQLLRIESPGLLTKEYLRTLMPGSWIDDHTDKVWENIQTVLNADGSNLFNDHWRCRCEDWLLEHGYVVCLDSLASRPHQVWIHKEPHCTSIQCPAAEFPARAIFALREHL